MLSLTHELIRTLNPENYGWAILAIALQEPRPAPEAGFCPNEGWSPCPTSARAQAVFEEGVPYSFTDATGTIILTIAYDGDDLRACLEGNGWAIENSNLLMDGWEDMKLPSSA